MKFFSTQILLSMIVLYITRVISTTPPPGSVVMKVVNIAGSPVELYWKNVAGNDPPLILQTTKPLRNGTETIINSYHTHEFSIKFAKPKDGKELIANFVKGPKAEVITIYYTPEKGLCAKVTNKFDELMAKVTQQTASCSHLKGNKFDICFANTMVDDISKLETQNTELVKYRDLMSSRLRNYTCDDDTMQTSRPIRSQSVNINNRRFDMDILFDTPTAKVWVVHDFVSDEECEILEEHGRSRLARATVADEDGSSIVSEHRKAQQASYGFHQTREGDPLLSLSTRTLQITNLLGGFNLQPDGQEDFTIIQYNPSDQYTPHCDGSCDGSQHRTGGRVATAVMYCKVADRGGGTTFTKADVFVKPYRGVATFFAYKGAADGVMDDGFTEHSGCPVLEGEKWITTMWMRDGVSRNDPWTNFDPSGARVETLQQMETEEEVAAHNDVEVGSFAENPFSASSLVNTLTNKIDLLKNTFGRMFSVKGKSEL